VISEACVFQARQFPKADTLVEESRGDVDGHEQRNRVD
jgi:hypothetical protein